MKQEKAFSKIRKTEQIIQFELCIFCLYVIIFLLIFVTGSVHMWQDILINIGCSIVVSISLSLFIYFRFLKHIPDETEKKIDRLLNDRLGYDASNHNAVMQALNPSTSHLSLEHQNLQNHLEEKLQVVDMTTSSIQKQLSDSEESKKLKYANLQASQREITDSIEKIKNLGEALKEVNQQNIILQDKNRELSLQLAKLKERYYALSRERDVPKKVRSPRRDRSERELDR